MTARPSPQREAPIVEQIKQALSEAGAFCGECGFEPGDRGCRDCEGCWKRYADDLLPIVRNAVAAELAAVRAERDEALENLTGAYLARWEEEQDNARLRLALESARRGRRNLRTEVAGMQVNYMIYRGGAAHTINALRDELGEVRAEHDEAALMRDFTDFHLRQLSDQRGEAESANEAWELGKITAEEALRRTDAAIQNHKTVTLDQFRAEREARS